MTESLTRSRHALPGLKGRRLLAMAAGGGSLWLYASTAAPWLSWANHGADGGDLIAAAMTWGVPHPSGYPTYCLLGRLYALLPLGPMARRFNLFSATMAAATVVLVYFSALRVLARASGETRWLDAWIGLITALACAVGPALWSQATIAEVYALHGFFFALCLYVGLNDDLLARSRGWGVLGLALGLGLGAHLTLLLILPGLMLLLWPRRAGRHLLAFAGGASLGLAIYAYLPLAARGCPPINWGDPSSWSGFWWLVSGRLYHPYAFGLAPGHLLPRLSAWARLWIEQYTLAGVALAVLGLRSWIARRWRRWTVATLLTFGAYTIYALAYDTADSYLYLIPAYLISALWMAEGARSVVDVSLRRSLRGWRLRVGAGLILLAAIPLYTAARHFERMDLSEDRVAERWSDGALGLLPEGALLVTGQDRHTFTLDYVQLVEDRRPDLLVIDGDLLGQSWYVDQVNRRHPSESVLEGDASVGRLIGTNLGRREVYLSSLREELHPLYRATRSGNLWRITRPN